MKTLKRAFNKWDFALQKRTALPFYQTKSDLVFFQTCDVVVLYNNIIVRVAIVEIKVVIFKMWQLLR